MSIFFKSKKLQFITIFSFIIAFTSCKQTKENDQSMETENILLSEWTGDYGGTPAFDKMNIKDIKPALEKGMAEKFFGSYPLSAAMVRILRTRAGPAL